MIIEDAFLDQVLPYVRGCPDQLAMQHVMRAIQTFCAKTLVWNYSCVPIKSEAGEGRYTLQIEEDQELVRALLVEVDGREYTVPSGVAGRAMARRHPQSYCDFATFSGPDFTLTPPPQVDDLDIVVDVAVRPKQTATEWPDDFAEYVTDIVHGAVGSLCELPKVDWRDAGTAALETERFNSRICVVQAKVSRGFGRSRRPVRAVWF